MAQALLVVLQGLGAVRRVTIPLFDSLGQHLDTLGAAPHLEELDLFLPGSPAGDDPLTQFSLFGGAGVGIVVDDPIVPLDDLHLLNWPEASSSPQASQGTTSAGPGTFPSLRILAVTGSLTDIADVVRDTTQDLEQLYLAVPSIQNEHEMTRAMRDIAAFCPHLNFIAIEFFSADHPEWVDFDPLTQRPLQIHTRHPRLNPNFLIWRIDDDGVVEAQIFFDHT